MPAFGPQNGMGAMLAGKRQTKETELALQPSSRYSDTGNVRFEEEFGEFLIAEKLVDRLVQERAASAARKSGERPRMTLVG